MNRDDMIRCMRDGCTYQQLHTILDYIDNLEKENQQLKEHIKVPVSCTLKTLEDYKNYYEDISKDKILEDTYIDYCAYVNLAHRYAKLENQLQQSDEVIDEAIKQTKFIDEQLQKYVSAIPSKEVADLLKILINKGDNNDN